jgi:RimJ/RimL family protein N-acetyltransferase
MVHADRFETPRLHLRPIAVDDVDLLVGLDSDPEVMRFLTGWPTTRGEVEEIIRACLGCRWVAFDRRSTEFVGWYGLVPRDGRVFEIGYRLARRWWGQGRASEGVRTLITEAFTERGASAVIGHTMAVNLASRRVMERCGMRHVRTFHLEWEDPLPGSDQGEVEYAVSAEEWQGKQLRS